MICKKKSSPEGLWRYKELIGSSVKITSMSCNSLFGDVESNDQIFTISDIYFKIERDGKIYPVCRLQELPERLITLKNLEIIDINIFSSLSAVCGDFKSSQALCGYEVSLDPSWEIPGGIELIDQDGNIYKNRYIRILDSKYEDLKTDQDQITDIDINIEGTILD